MAVTRNGIEFHDYKGGPSGGWSIKGGRSYRVKIWAKSPSQYVGPNTILKATGFRYGNYYRWPLCANPTEQDFGSFIQSIDIQPKARSGKLWELTFSFDPYDVNHEGGATDGQSFEGKTNPFLIPPDVSWSGKSIEKTLPYDYSATPKPYVNAAGDPLEDPPKTEDSNPVLSITRFEPTYDPLIVTTYRNRVNLGAWLAHDTFAGFPDSTVKCNEISAKRVYDPDWGVYWQVTYELELRLEPDETGAVIGWQSKVLNAGMRELVIATGKLKPVLVQGVPVSSPVCLKADGTFDISAAPNYLTFKPYKRVDFAGLDIPVTIFDSGLSA